MREEQVEYWQQQMQSTAENELKRQQEWSDRSDVHAQRHKQVLEEFDKRIAAAKAEAPAADPSLPMPSTTLVNERAKTCFFETVALDFDPQLLPKISPEDPAQPGVFAACGNLHQLIMHWMNAGAAVPFSFQQFARESPAGQEAKELVLRLLGEQGELWFGGEPAQDTDLVPRQAVIALFGVLEAAKHQYEGMEEAKKAAQTCYAKFAKQHKKRRVGGQPYAA